MPLGMVVGLDPGDIVLDGNPAPSRKKGHNRLSLPQFSAHVWCGQTAGYIKMPLGTEVGLDPSHIVLDGDPAPCLPPPKGAQQPLSFQPMSVVAKWSPISATAEHLFIFFLPPQPIYTLCI